MKKTYLALGDSYTIGESVAVADRWPNQVVARFRASGMKVLDPVIVAVTGWTTAELDAGINDAQIKGTFDLVTLLIGVNNQYRSQPLSRYEKEFAGLLERALTFADKKPSRVVVVSIPDWGVTPFAKRDKRSAEQIGKELDAYNAAQEAICKTKGVAFVDITAVSRQRGAEAAMVAPAGLHPSGKMYTLWTDLIEPVARQAIR